MTHLALLDLLADHEQVLDKVAVRVGLLAARDDVPVAAAVPAAQVAGDGLVDRPAVQLCVPELRPDARLVHLQHADVSAQQEQSGGHGCFTLRHDMRLSAVQLFAEICLIFCVVERLSAQPEPKHDHSQ